MESKRLGAGLGSRRTGPSGTGQVDPGTEHSGALGETVSIAYMYILINTLCRGSAAARTFPRQRGTHLDPYTEKPLDIPRAPSPHKKLWRSLWIGGGVVGLAAATYGLSQLEPAAPPVDESTILTDSVRQGLMVRSVRGPGKSQSQS